MLCLKSRRTSRKQSSARRKWSLFERLRERLWDRGRGLPLRESLRLSLLFSTDRSTQRLTAPPDEAVSPIVRVVTENIQSAVQPLSEEISQSSKIMRGARKENAASRKQTERLTEHIKSLDDTMQTIAGAVQNLVEIERRRQEMFDEMILASEDSSATQSSSERKEAPPSTPPPYDHSLSPVQGQDPRPLQSDDRPLRELFEAVSLFGKTRSNRSYAA